MNPDQQIQVQNRIALAQKLMREAEQIATGEDVAELDDAQRFALLVGHMLAPIKESLENISNLAMANNQEQKEHAKQIEGHADRISRIELHCFGRTYAAGGAAEGHA